jgi:sortase A
VAGLSMMAYVAVPIVSFNVARATRYEQYLSPVPDEQYSEQEAIDYTKAHNWFNTEANDFEVSKVRYYTLSIPKLNIKDATVALGGEDLSQSLIQYPGTALPGKRGNAVIFGHSILPQFFNPKNYMSIFSTLPTIKKGDTVDIRYDGISYNYVVHDVFEVKPTDLEILAQNTDDSYITLITCTPPGHPLRPRRLIVRARLDPNARLSDNGQNTWN